MIIRAFLQNLFDIAVQPCPIGCSQIHRGEYHDRNRAPELRGAQSTHNFKTIEGRHHQVEQDQIGATLGDPS
ncbi:hypothetical protein HC891_04555 [Candidatus Gracilibacteria bacterium]|nr:hypothetical protein [Candidatus Gracilibacteria bacterium]